MRKLEINEAITLLRIFEGSLDFTLVDPEDYGTQNALVSLAELKLIDPYDITTPLTEEGTDRVYNMLSYGINYDRHFEKATIEAKKASFLSLINSGYEPRGLMKILVNKISKQCFSELKTAFYDRKNISMGTNQRPIGRSSHNINESFTTKRSSNP